MIGWVGLGVIGLPMAARLAEAGWIVWGYDTDPARCEAAAAVGIRCATGPAECAERSDRLVACVVRTAEQVHDALLGRAGALRQHPARRAMVMSSIGAIALRRLAADAAELGSGLIDAPIHGNRAAAEDGRLTMLVSGDPGVVEEARRPLSAFSRAVVDLGERPGAAQVVKMISQHQQIIGMLATLEGVGLADAHGIDVARVVGFLSETSPSWTTDNWDYVRDLWERRDPQSSLTLFSKDLAAAIADGAEAGRALPLATEALRVLQDRYEPPGRTTT